MQFPLPIGTRYAYQQRFGTGPNDHHGTDIFAPEGTPVLAVHDGVAHASEEVKGGTVVYLFSHNGRCKFFYGHLKSSNLPPERKVKNVTRGEIIGFVGTTGNARGKAPHIHFQMSEQGTTIDPYPYLVASDPRKVREQRAKKSREQQPMIDWKDREVAIAHRVMTLGLFLLFLNWNTRFRRR